MAHAKFQCWLLSRFACILRFAVWKLCKCGCKGNWTKERNPFAFLCDMWVLSTHTLASKLVPVILHSLSVDIGIWMKLATSFYGFIGDDALFQDFDSSWCQSISSTIWAIMGHANDSCGRRADPSIFIIGIVAISPKATPPQIMA